MLYDIVDSPRLLTPSEFSSPAKTEGLVDITPSQPLLSPASIMAAQATQEPELQASQQSDSVLLPDTGTSVTNNFESIVEPNQDGMPEKHSQEDVITSSPVVETEVPRDFPSGGTQENSQLQASSDVNIVENVEEHSEEDGPEVEVVQKAFDNIFDILEVEPSHECGQKQTYEEFTELLVNPTKLQEQEAALENAGEIVSLHNETPQSGDEHSQIVNAAATKSPLLDVLKSSSQGRLEDVLAGTNEASTLQWPEIGGELSVTVIPSTAECDLDVTDDVKGELSSEKPDQFMPSALSGSQDSQDHGGDDETISTTHQDQDETSGEIVTKTRAKGRKRNKKGKKPLTSAGVVEVSDVPRCIYLCFTCVLIYNSQGFSRLGGGGDQA